MKTFFTLVLIVLFAGGTALAQTDKPGQPFQTVRNTGIKVGGNFTGVGEAEADVGFHGGVYVEMHTQKRFGFTAEALFSRQNSRLNDIPVTANYLTLPILLNLHADILRLQGGVYLAHLLNANAVISQGTDYGAVAGIKLDFGATAFGLAYLAGLKEVAGKNVSRSADQKIRNRNLQFSVGIDF